MDKKPKSEFKKELKSTTLIRGFLYKTQKGEHYLISVGRLFNKRVGSAVHKCSNLGKVEDWTKELFYSQNVNHEEVWELFKENFLNQQQ